MNLHELTFNSGRYRFLRHLIFWICWLLFSSVVQLTNLKVMQVDWGGLVQFQLIRTLTRIPSHILFCYVTVYYLVPKFIPSKKYKKFFFALIAFSIVIYWLNYFFLTPIFSLPGKIVGGDFRPSNIITPFIRKFFAFYSNINFTGPLPATCLMLAIKYYKDWYKKQQESVILQHENKLAELQLLKAQIHPHFLFNTLNNIYSFTLTGSQQAAALVDKLSGMIDYMITEGEKTFVPVEKEIQLLNDYIGLEKVRYGDRLDMQVSINTDHENKVIAPLLMIPFVENCFKHGASVMRGKQWIRMDINIEDDKLDFKMSNSKPPGEAETNNKKGIGLANVQKRLQLIYPGKYFLKTGFTSDSYSVHLQVILQQFPVLPSKNKTVPKLQSFKYE